MKPTDEYQPFSNGHEYRLWLANNCERGKGCRRYNPNASTSRDGCAMEVALAEGACFDGKIKAKHGLRCGLLAPGPNGEIVRADGDGSTLRCPEYRSRDEPDDRPRRGPQQPEGQMDLLDPRTAPVETRERVENAMDSCDRIEILWQGGVTSGCATGDLYQGTKRVGFNAVCVVDGATYVLPPPSPTGWPTRAAAQQAIRDFRAANA